MSNVKILFARLALLAVCGFVVGGAFTADPVIGYVVFGIMLVAVRLGPAKVSQQTAPFGALFCLLPQAALNLLV